MTAAKSRSCSSGESESQRVVLAEEDKLVLELQHRGSATRLDQEGFLRRVDQGRNETEAVFR